MAQKVTLKKKERKKKQTKRRQQQQQKTERVECEKSVNSSKEYASQIKKSKQNNFLVFFSQELFVVICP